MLQVTASTGQVTTQMKECPQQGKDAQQGAGRKKTQKNDYQRCLPLGIKEEAQTHRITVHGSKTKQKNEYEQSNDPEQDAHSFTYKQ